MNKHSIWSLENQSLCTMSLEREWARFLKTVSMAKELKLILLNFFFSNIQLFSFLDEKAPNFTQ